jgi:hypothetical protein
MAQKTNLNVSPYYDDFDSEGNFYKVLFNPGKPVQSRELTTLQSILQNQIETFGSNIFKEGSMVIPGNIGYDGQFYSVKLNSTNFGVDVSLYINYFKGLKITGQSSGTTAVIQYIALPQGNNIEDLTIYVKYLDSDNNFVFNPFQDGESLIANENVTYGNTTISAGTPFASLIFSNATSIGSAASIKKGVYFIRGYFVNVEDQTILLDEYTNTPSYRIGLKIDELIITAKDDPFLYDNAKGFTNYAAPGADRFKINLVLTKKLLTDTNDTDFVELLRVQDGKIKKIDVKTQYNVIKDYLAQRTYDESGDYSIEPFIPSIHNSLNDRLGNNGIYFSNETTDEGSTPSDGLMCVKVSPGKSYVRGYDVVKIGTTILDVEKPRDTEKISKVNIPFEMGNILRVNNVSGVPSERKNISLYNRRVGDSGSIIGDARVYTFNLTDASYSNATTNWDLYLYDIQTYTVLTLNSTISTQELPTTSFIKGKSSGSSGYAVYDGANSTSVSLRQTSGSFSVGEQIIINGLDSARTITSITVYSTQDIKSVYQSTSGFPTFTADLQLEKFALPNQVTKATITTGGLISSPSKVFTGVRLGSIIRYQTPSGTDEKFNRVTSISPDGLSMTVAALGASVSGICDRTLPSSTLEYSISIGTPIIRNESSGYLYAKLPDKNISTVELSDSNISISKQITKNVSSNTLTFSTSDFTPGISSSFLLPFDAERYSVHYSDGTIEPLTSDKFVLNGNTATLYNLNKSTDTGTIVNIGLVKNGIQSKIKEYNRSRVINITASKFPNSGVGVNTTLNDGLLYNKFYGLRVQDEEICLNYPDVSKVIAVYESFDSNSLTFDQIELSSNSNVSTNAIIGENILGNSSKAIARVVTKPGSNILGIVYLNENRFSINEPVTFEESNINTNIVTITLGSYKNITNLYRLDSGQKDQYYDYSRIVRNQNTVEPSRNLSIVFDHYTVPVNDDGDAFTVLSYDEQRFSKDIPSIGLNNVRASDTLDFRPRVSVFTGMDRSPFDFSSRTSGLQTDLKRILSPNESSLIGYSYYLARIDKLYIDKFAKIFVDKGISAKNPKSPIKNDDVMELATITLPPYLYDPQDARITLIDNRRYTMRDIGKIEDRVENLERVTSLTLLEVNTQTLQIKDADGNDRFKSGFFVDDFKNYDLINPDNSSIQVNGDVKELRPIISRNSLKSQLAPAKYLIDEELDLRVNFELLDPNVQKTGKAVTLKYDSIGWIEQPFATRVENVNPFNIIIYNGNITLSPEEDRWVRTIQLPDRQVSVTKNVSLDLGTIQGQNTTTSSKISLDGNWKLRANDVYVVTQTSNQITSSSTNTDVSTEKSFVGSYEESFMRSRNTEFSISNIAPKTQFYQFFDGNSSVDFIPKLVEISNDSTLQNYGASGSFKVGETVIGRYNNTDLISFRVASGDHKYGQYSSPTTTYQINPYLPTERLSSSYSSSSKVLNIDTYSLSEEAQGKYSGYLIKGMRLVGQTSGAVAYVKDLRLISDNYGDLIGSFFLRDPNTNPPPTVRIHTGKKTFKITSSSTNQTPLSGSTDISSAESTYVSEGIAEQFENIVTTTTTTTNTTITQISTNTETIARYYDPLAQTFVVGGNVEAPNPINTNDDVNGAFLTAIDLFFAKKDTENCPVKIEIRTVELGTPTRVIIGSPVTLRPDQVNVSDNAETATHVVFDYPIFLPPGREYAIVIISESSDKYELWTAQMGERTVNTASLPDAESVRYTRQFSMGSLFKSQNGSIWTANQYQDLKFKLYKAQFTSNTGTAFFYNPTLDESNNYIRTLNQNPVTSLSKIAKIGITTTYNSSTIAILTNGRKIGESVKTYRYGTIFGTGSFASSVGITTGGKNYISDSNVETFAITGNGSGLILNITANSGIITGTPTIVSPGNGYAIGDVVGIVTSTAGNTGTGANITITGNGNSIDTLYLSNVQAETFTIGATLNYYNDSGAAVGLGTTVITSRSIPNDYNSGNYMRVDHFDHGMYSKTNKLTISGIAPSSSQVILTSPLLRSEVNTINISDSSNFATFEKMAVSASNPGYVKVEDEIISYQSVGNGTLNTLGRGIDSTVILDHPIDSLAYKYQLNGISLRRINTTHDISDLDIGIDGYFIEIDRSSAKGTNRSFDGSFMDAPQLSFTNTQTFGGSNVKATENIQYDAIVPYYNVATPSSSTSVTASIRSITGTSISGNETSFLDNGFEPVQLNKLNKLTTTRLVCSNINEITYLTNLPRNKSLTTGITLKTTDNNLSPIIYCDSAKSEFYSNRIDKPIEDYASDNRVNSLIYDPHAAVYVSNTVKLTQPASSLKVILSAYRHESSDFRVLYSLIRADSSEIPQAFELFPGYDNLIYTNGGGYSVKNKSKNNGKPDVFVSSSLNNEFLEYQFTADNLDLFTGYTIKIVMSGTNQAYVPIIKQLRSIAVR